MKKQKSKSTVNVATQNQFSWNEFIAKYEKFDYIPFILYTIILLIINLIYHKIGDYGVETDFFWMYVPEAKKILNGTLPIDQFRGPVYPIVLALFKLIIGDFFRAGIIINTISAGIALYFFDKTLKLIFNRFIAFFTVLFIAFNPVFVQYTYSCGTDMLFLGLISLSLYFVFKKSKYNYYLAGFFTGLTYLIRYNGIFLVTGTIFFIIFYSINGKNIAQNNSRNNLKNSLFNLSKYLIVFLVTILPWGIYTKIEKGEFFYNQNYLNTAYEFQKNKISWDQYWQGHKNIKSTIDVVLQDPSFFISKVFDNLFRNFLLDTHRLLAPANIQEALQFDENNLQSNFFTIIIIIAFLIYLYTNHFKNTKFKLLSILKIENPQKLGLLTFLIIYTLILTLIFYSERFNLFLLLFYGIVLFGAIDFITNKFKLVGIILSSIFAIYVLTNSFNYNKDVISSGPEEILLASQWINSQNLPKTKIIARKPHIAYYTYMSFEVIPVFNTADEFLTKLNQTDADYLFASGLEINSRPFLQYILDNQSLKQFPDLAKKLTILHQNEYPFFILYKINK